MNLTEFQDFFVDHQKNYQVKESDRLAVLTLGLVGETGEVLELIEHPQVLLQRDLLKSELGDVLAYLSIVADSYSIGMNQLGVIALPRFIETEYSETVSSLALELSKGVCKVAEKVKKKIRDGGAIGDNLADLLGSVLSSIFGLIRVFRFDLKDVLASTVEKNKSRLERKTLHGSGDR
jgi:NTP pyrophosphatase (non-canonical NTP hydrolase)